MAAAPTRHVGYPPRASSCPAGGGTHRKRVVGAAPINAVRYRSENSGTAAGCPFARFSTHRPASTISTARNKNGILPLLLGPDYALPCSICTWMSVINMGYAVEGVDCGDVPKNNLGIRACHSSAAPQFMHLTRKWVKYKILSFHRIFPVDSGQ